MVRLAFLFRFFVVLFIGSLRAPYYPAVDLLTRSACASHSLSPRSDLEFAPQQSCSNPKAGDPFPDDCSDSEEEFLAATPAAVAAAIAHEQSSSSQSTSSTQQQ